MTHRQEPETGTQHRDRETPENATSGRVSAPHGENGAQDAGTPERAAGGRVGLRTQLDAAIRPAMLLGLQDAELHDEPGRERINEWADWILKTALEVRDEELEQLHATLARVRAFAADMRTWCSPHGIATDYADRLLEVLEPPDDHPAGGAR